MRGTEIKLSAFPARRDRIVRALQAVCRVFSVSQSLKDHAVSLGIDEDKIVVVGNGVDCDKFFPIDKQAARARYSIPPDAKVLISVGGPSLEGDMGQALQEQVAQRGLGEHVRFLGPLPSAQLHVPLSAADVFVLATSNEGWANVFLEAMACVLPVVTTAVGGNREVVCREELGSVVPFGDPQALLGALRRALAANWDAGRIIAYAKDNGWDRRVAVLCETFRALRG